MKRKVFDGLTREERRRIRADAKRALPTGQSSKAALDYAVYVSLMIDDLRRAKPREREALRRMCLQHCSRKNRHRLLDAVMEDNVWDMSPLLFERCLLGEGAKSVRAASANGCRRSSAR